jgi:hypothetical protein
MVWEVLRVVCGTSSNVSQPVEAAYYLKLFQDFGVPQITIKNQKVKKSQQLHMV